MAFYKQRFFNPLLPNGNNYFYYIKSSCYIHNPDSNKDTHSFPLLFFFFLSKELYHV